MGNDDVSNSLCPADGFMFNGFYNGCIEVTCPGERDSMGRCTTDTNNPPGAVAPPTDVSAFGYQDTVAGSMRGVAEVTWRSSVTFGVDGYRLRYIRWEKEHLLNVPLSGWTLVPVNNNGTPIDTSDDTPITGTSFSISGLELREAYMVQVQAYNNDRPAGERNSVWSTLVYVYPTARQITGNPSRLAGLPNPKDEITVPTVGRPLDGRLLTYTYGVCTSTLPPLQSALPGNTSMYDPDALVEIRNGINQWQLATGTLTVRYVEKECGPGERQSLSMTDNLVVLTEDVARMNQLCASRGVEYKKGDGCIQRIPNEEYGRPVPGDTRHIVIHRGSEYTQDRTKGCSQMHRVALHEAGHVFGLHHAPDRYHTYLDSVGSDYSAIWMPHDTLCTLTEHDLFAIAAIYESGFFTNHYVNFE